MIPSRPHDTRGPGLFGEYEGTTQWVTGNLVGQPHKEGEEHGTISEIPVNEELAERIGLLGRRGRCGLDRRPRGGSSGSGARTRQDRLYLRRQRIAGAAWPGHARRAPALLE